MGLREMRVDVFRIQWTLSQVELERMGEGE